MGDMLAAILRIIDEADSQVTIRHLFYRLVGLNIMRKLQEMFANPAVWQALRELAAVLMEKERVAGEELAGMLAGLSELRFVGR